MHWKPDLPPPPKVSKIAPKRECLKARWRNIRFSSTIQHLGDWDRRIASWSQPGLYNETSSKLTKERSKVVLEAPLGISEPPGNQICSILLYLTRGQLSKRIILDKDICTSCREESQGQRQWPQKWGGRGREGGRERLLLKNEITPQFSCDSICQAVRVCEEHIRMCTHLSHILP